MVVYLVAFLMHSMQIRTLELRDFNCHLICLRPLQSMWRTINLKGTRFVPMQQLTHVVLARHPSALHLCMQPSVSWIPNFHYSGIFGLMKLLLPEILPETVDKVSKLGQGMRGEGEGVRGWGVIEWEVRGGMRGEEEGKGVRWWGVKGEEWGGGSEGWRMRGEEWGGGEE